MSDVAELIERLLKARTPGYEVMCVQAACLLSSLSARIAELERERDATVESRNFTLSDHQRLLRRSDVEGICDCPGVCFEDPDAVARCGPCAIKAAEVVGVKVRYSIPNAPQEARLGRELRAAEAKLAKAVEALKFYRDEFKVKVGRPMPGASGITYHPSEALLDDCGNRAIDALAALSSMPNKEGRDGARRV